MSFRSNQILSSCSSCDLHTICLGPVRHLPTIQQCASRRRRRRRGACPPTPRPCSRRWGGERRRRRWRRRWMWRREELDQAERNYRSRSFTGCRRFKSQGNTFIRPICQTFTTNYQTIDERATRAGIWIGQRHDMPRFEPPGHKKGKSLNFHIFTFFFFCLFLFWSRSFFRFYWNLVCCLIYIWLCSVVRNVTWDSSLHIRRCLQDFPRDCSLTTRLATVATRRGGNSDEISTERKKKQPQVVLSDIEALHVTLRHVWFVYIF